MGNISPIQIGASRAAVKSIVSIHIASKEVRGQEARNLITRHTLAKVVPVLVAMLSVALLVAIMMSTGKSYDKTAGFVGLGCFVVTALIVASVFGLKAIWKDISVNPVLGVLAYNKDNALYIVDNMLTAKYWVTEGNTINISVKGVIDIVEVGRLLKLGFVSIDDKQEEIYVFMTRKELDIMLSKCEFTLDERNDFKKFVDSH